MTFGSVTGFTVEGRQGPACPTVTPIRGLFVFWPPTTGVTRLRWRLKGGRWQSARVQGCEKVLAPLASGVWQIAVAPVGGSWSPTVEMMLA
jgi:hypothetical protein